MANFDAAAWFQQHRTVALGSVFAGAALLGLRARSKAKSSSASVGTGTAGAATDATYAGTAGYYDSTANDVYNSMEPQIAALAQQLNALQNEQSAASAPPVATPPAPAPVVSAGHVPVGTVWGTIGTHYGQSPAPPPPVTLPAHTGGSWGTTGRKA